MVGIKQFGCEFVLIELIEQSKQSYFVQKMARVMKEIERFGSASLKVSKVGTGGPSTGPSKRRSTSPCRSSCSEAQRS